MEAMVMTDIRRRALVSGRVQGVCFRAYTRDAALRIGLTGWVRNLPDGRVEALFEGAPEKVKELIDWLHRGSPGSRVERVEIFEEPHRGDLTDFDVKYTRGWF